MMRLKLIKGDITRLAVEAIVNAANSSLLGGGGVDGAIHRAAGAELLHECRLLGGCKTGEAKITKGYNLPARHIIHTVGPVWRGGTHDEAALLAACYRNSFALAVRHNVKSLAFPAISTGIYRFPLEEATHIAVTTTLEFINDNTDALDEIIFVAFDDAAYKIYHQRLTKEDARNVFTA